MTRSLEHELMRLLHGELPSARAAALRERMKGSPELAAVQLPPAFVVRKRPSSETSAKIVPGAPARSRF